MVVGPDISEAIVIKVLESKGLRPKGTSGTFLQGCRRKRYGYGMNMTYQESCAILDAWPTSIQLPDEVILLDYKLDHFMAIVFCTNRSLETAKLIFEECQQSS